MSDKIDFITFFSYEKSPALDFHIGLLSIWERSLRNIYPDAGLHVLTDAAIAMILDDMDLNVSIHEIDQDELMLERLRLYLWWLTNLSSDTTAVFLDSDMVCVRRFDWALTCEADVTVTFRDWSKTEPVNGGFICVSPSGRAAAIRLLRKVISDIETFDDHGTRLWGGDQLALSKALTPVAENGAPAGPVSPGVHIKEDGTRVALLDCSVVNYSPEDGVPPEVQSQILRDDIYEDLIRRDLVHFKGPRKQYMKEFWARFSR